jgi:hypothetical protein
MLSPIMIAMALRFEDETAAAGTLREEAKRRLSRSVVGNGAQAPPRVPEGLPSLPLQSPL